MDYYSFCRENRHLIQYNMLKTFFFVIFPKDAIEDFHLKYILLFLSLINFFTK